VAPRHLAEKEVSSYMCTCAGERYGASIPIEKALSDTGGCILAYEMNGEPIGRDHGFPVRAIVPGHVAARSVKWLEKVIVSADESDSHWQQHDYKGFCPGIGSDPSVLLHFRLLVT
jgi:sulfite oxidase